MEDKENQLNIIQNQEERKRNRIFAVLNKTIASQPRVDEKRASIDLKLQDSRDSLRHTFKAAKPPFLGSSGGLHSHVLYYNENSGDNTSSPMEYKTTRTKPQITFRPVREPRVCK